MEPSNIPPDLAKPIMTLSHRSPLSALTFQHRIQPLLFIGDLDNTIHIWELNQLTCIQLLQGHSRSILALSTTKEYLVSSSADNSVRIWKDQHDDCIYECLYVFKGCNGSVLSISTFEVEEKHGKSWIFLGCQDTSIRFQTLNKIISTNESTNLCDWPEIRRHRGYVYTLKVYSNSKDEKILLSGSSDGLVHIHRAEDLKHVLILNGHTGSVFDLAVGNHIFSASEDKTIRCWDIETFQCRGILEGHTQAVMCLYWIENEKDYQYQTLDFCRLISTSKDSSLCIWDVTSFVLLYSILYPFPKPNFFSGLKLYKNFLYTISNDAQVDIFDMSFCFYSSSLLSSSKNSSNRLSISWSPSSSYCFPCFDSEDASMVHALNTFVSFQSVSGNLYKRQEEECWKAAKYLNSLLLQLGASSELVQQHHSINPLVLGTLGNDADKPTLLICGHYDVQPADEEGWESPPFVLTGKDGYLYGRGATDDKGPLIAILFAIQRLIKQNKMMPNFIFLFQGEGENGSTGFKNIVQEHLQVLSQAQCTFISNNYWVTDETPCLTYGMRGLLQMLISIEGSSQNRHAGVDGGVFRQPLHDLIALLNNVVHPTNDKCLAPTFYDSVRSLSLREQKLYQNIQFDVKQYKQQLGVSQLLVCSKTNTENNSTPTTLFTSIHEDDHENTKEQVLITRWCTPSLSVTGITTSSSNATIIPYQAQAQISIRTVPDQNPKQIEKLLIKHIQNQFQQLQTNNSLQIDVKSNVSWWLGDFENIFFQLAAKALKKNWNIDPVYVREGGTSQVTQYLQETLGVPCVLFPMGQASDGAHLQNERIRLLNFTKGRDVIVDFFHAIAMNHTSNRKPKN